MQIDEKSSLTFILTPKDSKGSFLEFLILLFIIKTCQKILPRLYFV